MSEQFIHIDSDGIEHYYKNREMTVLHREDGGPCIIHPDGTKFWYKVGQRHRDNGPSIEYPDGTKHWFKDGKRHREDGPAVEYPDGTEVYYINGKHISKETFLKRTNPCDGKIVEIDGRKYKLTPA